MFGNMKLIVELYINRCITESIILECIAQLFQETNDLNVEIIAQMIEKLGNHIVSRAPYDQIPNVDEEEEEKGSQGSPPLPKNRKKEKS